eukprot:4047630-Alexandrium_andersonii.AAC.1
MSDSPGRVPRRVSVLASPLVAAFVSALRSCSCDAVCARRRSAQRLVVLLRRRVPVQLGAFGNVGPIARRRAG